MFRHQIRTPHHPCRLRKHPRVKGMKNVLFLGIQAQMVVAQQTVASTVNARPPSLSMEEPTLRLADSRLKLVRLKPQFTWRLSKHRMKSAED